MKNPADNPREKLTEAARTQDTADFSFDPSEETTFVENSRATTGSKPAKAEIPKAIGRYRVEKVLGQGGFGCVYLAYDDELRRNVTIKVPHRHRIRSHKDIDSFLTEARTLAKLEHPNVVPVHDLGHTDEGLCYIVSRYIDGRDLYRRMRATPLTLGESVELVTTIAEALHYVHSHGVIHRDIKPNNILLDKRGTAYLADFGLALTEDDAIRSSTIAGTPAYMSPEQARGENHLVVGTSDIFSLGIVLYEMIMGKRPFTGENSFQVLRAIQEQPLQSLRDTNKDIPAELDRICLKALSKRASDRHKTALDLADDLRHFLSQDEQLHFISGAVDLQNSSSVSDHTRSSRQFLGIVPKGLRSFGPEDAHFFLGLLPGPYDRMGVPESVRFWQKRIEERDPHETFRVGLIYGPSGCGKSSFVKAGLIPTLSPDVTSIVIEAAPDTTETRLLNRLRRSCPYLDTELDLRASISSLRRGTVMGEGKKVLIVIDQFEQWLYSVDQPEHSELAKALRQCDGEHVQCILMVRDDFWLTFSRFMDHLEVELMQNHNMALLDLFDLDHARRVLTEFGRAFHRLPEQGSKTTRDQKAFVSSAIEGLSENGKVTPVRLALFAEMIKSKPWTTASLRKIGGTQGVGVMFLDENFVSENAPADYRIHQDAVYKTLGELLPQPGANLKGHMKSREELLLASGYAEQPKQFHALMRALDTQLHLVTRTDPEGRGDAPASESTVNSANRSGQVYYQLAHDYLVPAIRDWQSRMQRGTRKGRAEIRLAQRSEVWHSRPEKRHLPSWMEWVSILALTQRDRWDDAQKRMMKVASWRHSLSTLVVVALVVATTWASLTYVSWNRADALTKQLSVAKVAEVDELLEQLDGKEQWTADKLKQIQAANASNSQPHLFATLALLRSDEKQLAEIEPSMLQWDPDTTALLCRELKPHSKRLINKLWEDLGNEKLVQVDGGRGRKYSPRFNAALLLANFDPPNIKRNAQGSQSNDSWEQHTDFVVDQLLSTASSNARYYNSLLELIEPSKHALVSRISEVIVDDNDHSETATNLLVDLLEKDTGELANLLLHADLDQLSSVVDIITRNPASVRPMLDQVLDQPINLDQPTWNTTAKRKATAAALLLRQGASSESIWSVFKPQQVLPRDLESKTTEWLKQELCKFLDDDRKIMEEEDRDVLLDRYKKVTFGNNEIPDVKTNLVQRLVTLKANPVLIAQRLLAEEDVAIQVGLIQSLGEFKRSDIPSDLGDSILTLAKGWFLNASDARLRSNAVWFLNLVDWETKDWMRERLDKAIPESSGRNWYVNTEGHTMIRLPQHAANATYRVEAAMGEVTMNQLRRSRPNLNDDRWFAFSSDSSVGGFYYHDAVAYCNWLSRKEGLDDSQLCYPDRDLDSTGPPVLIYADYQTRTGYRLPMADEWFFMTQAGAITKYAFGETEQHAFGFSASKDRNITYAETHSWPIAHARPNAYGIFDTYMNQREWTNDIDPNDTTRFQVCGHDFRFAWGADLEPRYLGYSHPNATQRYFGLRVFRSRPNPTDEQDSVNESESNGL